MSGRPPAGTYLLQLNVRDTKSFRGPHVLDLRGPNGTPSRWTLILGDNGVGKTTLLQCIAATAPFSNVDWKEEQQALREKREPKSHLEPLAWGEDSTFFNSLGRVGKNIDFEISALYSAGGVLVGHRKHRETFQLGVSFTRRRDKVGDDSFSVAKATKQGLKPPLVISYGAGRKVGESGTEVDFEAPLTALFQDENVLINAESLLEQLDYAAVRRDTVEDVRQKTIFLELLAGVLPYVSKPSDFIFAGPSPLKPSDRSGVLVRLPYGEVPMKQLSYGYQTMVAWLVDLAWRMCRHYPKSENPLGQPAIVLVDEIDLHLHPKWQRDLQQRLAAHFPAVQFIATGHSPFLAQASAGQNIAVVEEIEGSATIRNDPGVLANWRIEQIVNSDLFAVPPWSYEVEQRLEEQRRLTRKTKRTPAENRRLEALEKYARGLPTGLPDEFQEALSFIRDAAAEIRAGRK